MGAAPQHRADPSWPQPHQIPSWIPVRPWGLAVPCATPCPRGSDPLNPSLLLLSPRGAFFLLSKPSELISSCPRSSPPPPPRRPPNSSPQPRRALGEGAGGQPALWGLVGPPPGLRALLRKLLLERKSEQDKNNPGLAGKHGPGGTVPGQHRDLLLPPGYFQPGGTAGVGTAGTESRRHEQDLASPQPRQQHKNLSFGSAAPAPLPTRCGGRRCPCPRRGKKGFS